MPITTYEGSQWKEGKGMTVSVVFSNLRVCFQWQMPTMNKSYVLDVRPSVLRALAGNVYCNNPQCMAIAGEACKYTKDVHKERLDNVYEVLRSNNPTVKRDHVAKKIVL